MSIRMIKCPNCGVFNTNRDYCKNCNTLISNEIKREIKAEAGKQKRVEEAIYEKENPNFVERLKKHPFFLLRYIGWLLYSVYFVVSAVGAGIAWFIATIAS